MKKIKIILLTVLLFALSNCEIKVQESNAQDKYYQNFYEVYTDKLGCTWLIASTYTSKGGIYAQHHPTCKNSRHAK